MKRPFINFNILFVFAVLSLTLGLAGCTPRETGTDAENTPASESTAVSPTPSSSPTPAAVPATPEGDLFTFQDQLGAALAGRDFAALEALMSADFAVGAWRSEWRLYTPEQATDLFFEDFLAADAALEFQMRTANEITTVLDGQPAAEMLGPTVNIVSFLQSSGWGPAGTAEAILFVVEEDGQYLWKGFLYTAGTFAQAAAGRVSAPIGLVYRLEGESLYMVDLAGERQLLTANPLAQPSPDGRFTVFMNDERQLSLINLVTGSEELIGSGANFSGFVQWGDKDTLLVGVWLDPNEGEGPNLGHMATLDIKTGALEILAAEGLSGHRPAMATDGQWVAYDLYLEPPLTGQLYHPDSGQQTFDPAEYTGIEVNANGVLFNPGWSPAGDQIAWLVSSGERVDLNVYDLEERTAANLFDWDPARFGALIPSPVWSPDGRWIALEVWANGPTGSGLWLIATDGSSQLLIDAAGAGPFWANAEQLVYNNADSGGVNLFDIPGNNQFPLDLPAGIYLTGFINPEQMFSATENIPVAETAVAYVQMMQDVTMVAGPGPEYAEIGTIFDGQTALVTGSSLDSYWWRVICPDDSSGNCWVTADTAYTMPVNSAEGSAEPEIDSLTFTTGSTPSPDGGWQATITQSDPVLVGDSEKFYTTLTVSDGDTTWTPVAEWRGYGLGYVFPAVVHWSADSSKLYFTNTSSPDGCAIFVNGSDLFRLDVTDGRVKELLPPNSTAYMRLSPDETAVAYTSYMDNQVTLHWRDLQDLSETRLALSEKGQFAQSGGIVWSADGTQLLITLAYDACNPGWSHSILLVDLEEMTSMVLIDKDESLYMPVSWSTPGLAQVVDMLGDTWLMNVETGEVTAEN